MRSFCLCSHKKITTKDKIFYSFNVDYNGDAFSELEAYKKSNWKLIPKGDVSLLSFGIYVFLVTDNTTNKKEIAYVGCSEKLSIRLYSHIIFRFLTDMLVDNLTTELYVWKTKDYKVQERLLINKFKPFLNHLIYPERIWIENDKVARQRINREKKKRKNNF